MEDEVQWTRATMLISIKHQFSVQRREGTPWKWDVSWLTQAGIKHNRSNHGNVVVVRLLSTADIKESHGIDIQRNCPKWK